MASCRVCLVKIEKMPKLQTSCSTPAPTAWSCTPRTAESHRGARRRVRVPAASTIRSTARCATRAASARCRTSRTPSATMQSRMDFPRRTFDGEGVKADVDFGPDADAQPQSLHHVHALRPLHGARSTATRRSASSTAATAARSATFNEQGVHSLLSGNLMDVCPVGAITTKRVPLPLAPVGQPERGRHDLHRLLEGLRHHGLAARQARMGQGLAAGARHAALQPGGERLLDVRHRPLPVPTGSKAPTGCASRMLQTEGRRAAGRHLEGRAHQGARSAERGRPPRSGLGALPRLGPRQPRRAVPRSQALGQALLGDAAPHASTSRGAARPSRSRPTRSSWCPPTDAPNVTGARDLGLAWARASTARRTSRACARRSKRRLGGRALRGRSGPGRVARRRDLGLEAKAAGKIKALVYQGVLTGAMAAAADVVLPGAAWVEKDGCFTNDQGMLQAASRALRHAG